MPTSAQVSLFGDDDIVTRPALPHGCSWDCLLAMVRHGAELRVNHRLAGYFVYWRKEAEEAFWPELRRDYMRSRGYPDHRIRHWMKTPGWEDRIPEMIVEAPEAVYQEAWRLAEESGAGRSEIDWRSTALLPEDAYAR